MLLASCITPRQVNYLQDMKHESVVELENKFEAVICPYDELDIYVSSPNEDLARPFNLGSSGLGGTAVNRRGAYLVDVNGDIMFPVLGSIHASGLTRLQLQDTIKARLEASNYLTDATVIARFTNFRIFFLGAEGGKVISINNERCTFLEALAQCGDLSVYSKRTRIAVMREVDGKIVTRYLDPRSSKVFKDPFFMMQQNDFIITQSFNKETSRREASNLRSWIAIFTSFMTFGVTLYSLYTRYTPLS